MLEATGRLTGCSGFRTCPVAYTRLPWVGHAARAYRDREKGCLWLHGGEGAGGPAAALMEAVYAVESGVLAAEAHAVEKQRRELDEMKSRTRDDRTDHG